MTDPKEVEWMTKEVFIPSFQLPSTEGCNLGPREFKQRQNLILVFLHGAECIPSRTLLKDLTHEYPKFQTLDAELLVIVGGEERAANDLHDQMELFFPLLLDPQDGVAALCLCAEGMLRPAILVADRYNILWARLLPNEEDGAIEIHEVLQQLQFFELQCPECSVLDLPPL